MASENKQPLKLLIASHGHPRISKGGAENAAYALFQGISAKPDYKAWFLGCQRENSSERLGSRITQPFTDDEFLYSAGAFEWFQFANRDPRFPYELEDLMKELRPDIVHFHHYINFGVESFEIIKRVLPESKIVVTLHEYLAICHHLGQMITSGSRHLCYEESPTKCNKCFSYISPSDFFLRKSYIRRFFDLVDYFISPSHFLADRYISWGVPAEKIMVLENVIPHTAAIGSAKGEAKDAPLRIGFFGQISMLKGINVLLDAADALLEDEVNDVVFEVFGDYRGQPPEFQKDFLERQAKAGRNVRFHGAYDLNRVDLLIQSVDATVIPSIWWENSPVVIQEAFRNQRPVLCSDIGGMAEKVRDGIDGFHFPVGSALALSSLLKRLAEDRSILTNISQTMKKPPEADLIIDRHLDLYHDLLSSTD